MGHCVTVSESDWLEGMFKRTSILSRYSVYFQTQLLLGLLHQSFLLCVSQGLCLYLSWKAFCWDSLLVFFCVLTSDSVQPLSSCVYGVWYTLIESVFVDWINYLSVFAVLYMLASLCWPEKRKWRENQHTCVLGSFGGMTALLKTRWLMCHHIMRDRMQFACQHRWVTSLSTSWRLRICFLSMVNKLLGLIKHFMVNQVHHVY